MLNLYKTGMFASNPEKVAPGGLFEIQESLLKLRDSSIQLAEAQQRQINALFALSQQVAYLHKAQESSVAGPPPGLSTFPHGQPHFSSVPSFEYLPPPPSMPTSMGFLPRHQPMRVSLDTSTTTTTSSMRLDPCGGSHAPNEMTTSSAFRPKSEDWARAMPWGVNKEKGEASRLLAMTAAKAAAAEAEECVEAQPTFADIVTAVMGEYNRQGRENAQKAGKPFVPSYLMASKISKRIQGYETRYKVLRSVLPPRDSSYSGPSFQDLLMTVPGMVKGTTTNRHKVVLCFCFAPDA